MVSTQWPEWDSDQVLDLVRYVSGPALKAAALDPVDHLNEPDPARARAIAAHLYGVLAERRIPYAHEPWSPGDLQRIRSPRELLQTAATCTDLAVTYAAMCFEAQLRPMLVLASHHGGKHVLVLLDLTEPRSDGSVQARPPLRPLQPDDPGQAGRYDLDRSASRGHLLAVDVALAALEDEATSSFEDAARSGDQWLDDPNVLLDIADVVHARHAGVADELDAPEERYWPPIHSRLVAPAGVYESFPSRRPVEDALASATGRVVVSGESGLGKSMLAYRTAVAAEHGYGWFLTASDKDTLITQLAYAELAERPGDDEKFDRVPFADAALARLSSTDAPWVVVLDNANCSPADLGRYIPVPRGRQTLIVTTTNTSFAGEAGAKDSAERGGSSFETRPTWAKGAPVVSVQLAPLTQEEAADDLPEWTHALVGGSPLLGRSLREAINSGGEVGEPRAVEPVELVWTTATSSLDPDARRFADIVPWLPATGISTEGLRALGFAEDTVEKITASGLVGRDGRGRMQMHRLLSKFGREQGGDPRAAVLRVLAAQPLHRTLVRDSDNAVLAAMDEVLDGCEPTPDVAGAWLGLGRVREYRGDVRGASERFRRALETGGAALSPVERADCLQGRARWVFQNTKATDEEVREARSWLETLTSELDPDDPEQQLRVLRADAMDALLRRKAAGREPDLGVRREQLLRVRTDLQESLDARVELLAQLGRSDVDDVDRAEFNLAGTEVALAKCTRGAEAQAHHAAAQRHYQRVGEIRRQRYGDVAIPHIASCTAGEGINDYNRVLSALLELPAGGSLASEEAAELTDLLRQATAVSVAGLTDRQTFEGDRDGLDAEKSLALLVKVLLLRLALVADTLDPLSEQGIARATAAAKAFDDEVCEVTDRRVGR